MEHLIRLATKEEAKIDCCGDRYECNVDYVCSCGEKSCRSCMMRHIFSFHWDVEAEKARIAAETKASAEKKLAGFTKEEREAIGI